MTDLAHYLTDPVELILDELVLPAGQPYRALAAPWQVDTFRAIFAAGAGAVPRHRLVYSERRRGESKTEDVAAAGLADLLCGPPRHRSYVVAGDEDQAALVLDSVEGFRARSPILADVVVQRGTVRNTATGAELRVLASDARTAYGIRPRRVYFDELSLQRDERLWTAMWSAVGKDPRSQLVAVSMSGWDFTSLGWRIRELARGSEAYYFATREGTELAPWLSAADMEEQRATLHPADFARFWECRWTEAAGSWITSEMYEAAETGVEAFSGSGCVGFVDVGLVHDATAVAVCHGEDGRVVLDKLDTLQGTRAAPVELEVLERLVEELTQQFGVRRWRFEAPQAAASVQRLQSRLRCEVELRYPTAATQAELFGTLYRLFAGRRLVLYPHARLRLEALNLVTRTVGGRLKVVDSSAIHQDHVVALGGAAELVEDRAADVTVWTVDGGSMAGRDFDWVGDEMVYRDDAGREAAIRASGWV